MLCDPVTVSAISYSYISITAAISLQTNLAINVTSRLLGRRLLVQYKLPLSPALLLLLPFRTPTIHYHRSKIAAQKNLTTATGA
jgi:hypothetical protein